MPMPTCLSASSRSGALRPRTCPRGDRKSTRLNSSHLVNSYAVFCLKKKIYTTSRTPSCYLGRVVGGCPCQGRGRGGAGPVRWDDCTASRHQGVSLDLLTAHHLPLCCR